ncbi:hypothetical protein ACG3SL_16120 [Sphingomonas sp. CJ20]
MPAWRATTLAGLATLILSAAFARIPGLAACGRWGGSDPALAFQLARSAAERAALFGAEPCTSQLIAAQRDALWLDLFAFIPAYAAFLTLGAWALRDSGRSLARAAIGCVALAAALDLGEGVLLFRILASLPGDAGAPAALFWIVRAKFALLSLGVILIAALAWRQGPLAKAAAGAMLAGGLVSLVWLVRDPLNPLMTKGHAAAWIALLALAALHSFTERTREATA